MASTVCAAMLESGVLTTALFALYLRSFMYCLSVGQGAATVSSFGPVMLHVAMPLISLNQSELIALGDATSERKTFMRVTVSLRQLTKVTNAAPPIKEPRTDSRRPEANTSLSDSDVMSEMLTVVILGLGRLPSFRALAAWKLVRWVHMHASSGLNAHPGPWKDWLSQSHQHIQVLFAIESVQLSPTYLRYPASVPSYSS